MKISYQAVKNSKESIPTLLFTVSSGKIYRKYIFNMDEPFHRHLKYHGFRFDDQYIFFSRLDTDHMHGLFPIITEIYKTE